ncbi:peptidase inhibitor family I36 protein [Streptomyces sp. NPDC005474]|uniref:peptidase inhibitor family I36 protein n=1 Tax=Streptomyces sp. NPDC005474 TaxID=3154878 RepID=UPI003454FD83
MKKRNWIGIAVSVGITLGSTVIFPSTASAVSYSCPVDYLCVYDNNSFTGQVYAFHVADGYREANLNMDPPTWLNGVYLNDHISSIINNSNNGATFYKDANYKGAKITVPSKSWNSKLSTTGFDNSISSFNVIAYIAGA